MGENSFEEYKQLVKEQAQVLLDVVRSVTLGNLDVEVEVPEGQVLSELAVGIEMMVGELQEMLAGHERARAELEDIQAHARREQALREITARVRGSTDPDAIARAVARELGVALGRPAFIRLGSAEELVSGDKR